MSPRLLSFLPDSGEGRGRRGWMGACGVFSLYGMSLVTALQSLLFCLKAFFCG